MRTQPCHRLPARPQHPCRCPPTTALAMFPCCQHRRDHVVDLVALVVPLREETTTAVLHHPVTVQPTMAHHLVTPHPMTRVMADNQADHAVAMALVALARVAMTPTVRLKRHHLSVTITALPQRIHEHNASTPLPPLPIPLIVLFQICNRSYRVVNLLPQD